VDREVLYGLVQGQKESSQQVLHPVFKYGNGKGLLFEGYDER
jgi:hypothetical protein